MKKSRLGEITNEIKNQTIQIRKRYHVKLPDAIIVATAIVNDLTLITADVGFKKIEELKLKLIKPD